MSDYYSLSTWLLSVEGTFEKSQQLDSNHNHLVHKGTLNHLAKLAKLTQPFKPIWLNGCGSSPVAVT